jgi:membrane-bound lytic murein transglycosylase A
VRIGRRNENNELVPYHDRAAIEAGALDGQKLEICWLKSPLDLFVIQIEGSARVILEDGTPLRVSYDSHNGYRYSSIERVLIERNLIPREEMSPQRIRDWMAANPDEAAKVRATNRSYVFFHVTGLSNEGEPVGAQGVPLTPGRSIAVDRLHEYGTPFFIEASLPIDSAKSVSAFGRLMIAQDTGSAIVGPARADLYWGAGDDAGRIAGRIRHRGRFAMLLPRELDMMAAGTQVPLPAPKPKIPGGEDKNQDGKGRTDLVAAGEIGAAKKPSPNLKTAAAEVTKQSGKATAPSTKAGQMGAGRKLPLTNLKTAASEGSKQEGQSKTRSAKAADTVAAKQSRVAKTATPGIDITKQRGKGKAESASSDDATDGRKIPSSKPKVPPTEVKKQDSQRKATSAPAGEGGKAAVRPGAGKPPARERAAAHCSDCVR